MKKILFGILLLSATLSAQNLTGIWNGAGYVQDSKYGKLPSKFQMTLTQAGSVVTGTLRKDNGKPVAISHGAISGSQVTFSVQSGVNVVTAKLNVQGSTQLQGSMTTSKGQLYTVALQKK